MHAIRAPGSQWELDEILRSQYLGKTVFLMPWMPWYWLRRKDLKSDWDTVVAHLKKRGLEVPPYHRKGLLFAIRPTGCFVEDNLIRFGPSLRAAIGRLSSITPSSRRLDEKWPMWVVIKGLLLTWSPFAIMITGMVVLLVLAHLGLLVTWAPWLAGAIMITGVVVGYVLRHLRANPVTGSRRPNISTSTAMRFSESSATIGPVQAISRSSVDPHHLAAAEGERLFSVDRRTVQRRLDAADAADIALGEGRRQGAAVAQNVNHARRARLVEQLVPRTRRRSRARCAALRRSRLCSSEPIA